MGINLGGVVLAFIPSPSSRSVLDIALPVPSCWCVWLFLQRPVSVGCVMTAILFFIQPCVYILVELFFSPALVAGRIRLEEEGQRVINCSPWSLRPHPSLVSFKVLLF